MTPNAFVLANQGPNAADWIAAIGQALGALFTLVAVVAALWIALRDQRDRQREQKDQALAQARLVRVRGTGVRPVEEDGQGQLHELTIYFTNHSDRPVLDVYGEAWPADNALDEPPRWAVTSDVVLSGQDLPLVMRVNGNVALRAWRARWTDADGRQWCVDRRGEPPVPFKGQPPRMD
ncbi:hypothetical protein ABZS66_35800 [Dactylosporangium sp. NPDC005572]|uniref:hypothetical protein n=1 Tax=Dactylosporangium sp. NPDC005572 TaxID=3156889 RepID=UPI0033B8EEBF